MKKILLSFVFLVSILFITGCGNKIALSAETFKQTMEGDKFVVHDITEQFTDTRIKKSMVAVNDNFQLDFYIIDSTANAAEIYNSNKILFEKEKTNKSIEKEVIHNNYAKYRLITEDRYYVISRVDNTYIYIVTDRANIKGIDKYLDKFDY